jgi:uncharacterized protein YcfL
MGDRMQIEMKTQTLIHVLGVSLLAGTLLLAGFGCSTVNRLEPAQPVAQRERLADQQVITDVGLHNRVRVLGVNQATGPGGFLKIQVEVLNLTSKLQSFTYRVEWFDENGMVISLPTKSAIPRTLEGKETAVITATAPTERAKDFRIQFLESTR